MVRFQVQHMDGFPGQRIIIGGAEGKRRPVRRPGRVPVATLSALPVGQLPGRATVKGHYVDPAGLPRTSSREGNLFSVGRPVKQTNPRRRGELEAPAPIRGGSKKRSV